VSSELQVIPAVSLPIVRKGAPFKKLKMIHRKVVALHLTGMSNADIDRILEKPGYAGSVLTNETVKPVLARAYEEYDMELKALVPLAIQSFRKNVECGDPAVEVRAAKEILMVNGKYDGTKERQATAEDVIERILEQISPDGTRTRYAERRVMMATPGVQKWDDSGDKNA